MIKDVKYKKVSEVLDSSTTGGNLFVIPDYQREYKWQKEHWSYLFNDIDESENELNHFLGTILCVQEGNQSKFEVVDGQQRLTTLSILYLAIYARIKYFLENPHGLDLNELNPHKYALEARLRVQNGQKIILTSQNQNNEDFKFLLASNQLIPSLATPRNFGNRRISKVFNYFKSRVDEYNFSDLKDFLTKLDSALIVQITVENYQHAYILFESLNNRGEPLTPVDIIKNNIFKNGSEINLPDGDLTDRWNQFLSGLSTYQDQERFFRHLYNAFKGEEPLTYNKAPSVCTRSNLITIYEKLLERKPEEVFNEIQEKSIIYSMFLNTEGNDEFSVYFKDLIHINFSTGYLLLIYLFSKFSKNKKELKKVCEFLVKYAVRRNLTDFPATRDLDRNFMELIGILNESPNRFSDSVIKFLSNPRRSASFEVFKEKLMGGIYDENVRICRFLLCKLEESNRPENAKSDLWETSGEASKKYSYTIEHVLPEGNLPSHWIQMLAQGDIDRAKEIQSKYAHTLGNLTLTVSNAALSQREFSVKKNFIIKNRKAGYNDDMWLNQQIAAANIWTSREIENRTEVLRDKILAMFDYPLVN